VNKGYGALCHRLRVGRGKAGHRRRQGAPCRRVAIEALAWGEPGRRPDRRLRAPNSSHTITLGKLLRS
jgi:hypothetical protein